MLTKKQLKLLRPFMTNIFKEYSYKDIVKLAKEKSNNALQTSIKQFIKEDLITERKIGITKLYAIKSDNEGVYDYLSLLKFDGLNENVIQSIESLKYEIEKYTLFYSLVIFGSYSTRQQKKDSDLDVAILIPDKSQENNMRIVKNLVGSRALLPLHLQVINFDEFFEMLTNKQANVGKEIARKHRVVHNLNIFYKIVKKATDHGFKY